MHYIMPYTMESSENSVASCPESIRAACYELA